MKSVTHAITAIISIFVIITSAVIYSNMQNNRHHCKYLQTANDSSNSSNNDVAILARLIYGEARGEPYIGQVAVGAVIMNRTRDSRFPNTIAGVIYQPGAFDAVSDGQINMQPDGQAQKAAGDAFNGWDPSDGCVYYFNPSTATSKWIWSRQIVKTIGKHKFAK